MPIKQTVPTNSGDYLQFGNATTPVAAQVGGYEDSTGNGHLELYTTASGTVTERARVDSAGNVLINQTSADTGAKLSVTGGIKGTITSGTAVASTSGTSITFTGIPSWVKRITVMLNGVSTSGSSPIQIQIGSGSVTTSGYSGVQAVAATQVTSYSSGFVLNTNIAASTNAWGHCLLTNVSGNIWAQSGISSSTTNVPAVGAGVVTLTGTLDRVVLTTVNGTDTFDAGSVNILYEG